jgi:hypothetical protein
MDSEQKQRDTGYKRADTHPRTRLRQPHKSLHQGIGLTEKVRYLRRKTE